MQVLQRSLMVLLAAFFLMFMVLVFCQEQRNRGYVQWEEMQIERFLYQLCMKGSCTYEEYLVYQKAVNMAEDVSELMVKEYQKEWDFYGNTYWYPVTWEEIKEYLILEGNYSFQEGSTVELCVVAREGKRENRYYGVVRRKDR